MREARDAVADQVVARLVAGDTHEVAGLGRFALRVYPEYNGRNPRTGEPVHVPEKRLVFFVVADEVREYLNGRGQAPATAWVAAIAEDLRAGKARVFGRVGTFGAIAKAADDDDGPARTALSFVPSLYVQRRLAGATDAELRVADGDAVTSALASLPAKRPKNIAELDAVLATVGIEHASVGLVAPESRDASGEMALVLDEDGDALWSLKGRKVIRLTADEDIKVSVARWAADMLVVAAVRHAAGDALLDAATAEKVLAVLGTDSTFGPDELPF